MTLSFLEDCKYVKLMYLIRSMVGLWNEQGETFFDFDLEVWWGCEMNKAKHSVILI
jgi:hypothetical protein